MPSFAQPSPLLTRQVLTCPFSVPTASIAPAFQAVPASTCYVYNNGDVVLAIRNASASSVTVTIARNPRSTTGPATSPALTIAAGATAWAGVLPAQDFNDPANVGSAATDPNRFSDYAKLTFSATASVSIAVLCPSFGAVAARQPYA